MRWRSWRWAAAAVLATTVLLGVALRVAPLQAQEHQTYVVLFKQPAVPTDAAGAVARAGGTLTASYDAIGVAIAQSDADGFRERLLRDGRIEGVATSSQFPARLDVDAASVERDAPAVALLARAGDKTPAAVAILDTGADPTAGIDAAASTSCVHGLPETQPAAWHDTNGRGTRVADAILHAAGSAGGDATSLRVAAIKVADGQGNQVYPEAVVCGLVWAADHHLDVAAGANLTSSLLASCRDEPQQRTIFYAEERALAYARAAGVRVEIAGRDMPPGAPDPLATPVEQGCVAVRVHAVGSPPAP